MLLPFSLCGESVSLKPSREEWLLSTRANICPVLNWANMDKVNTIAFSVPGCLPCCPFIPFLSLHCRCRADCWLIIAHTHVVFKQITGWGDKSDNPFLVCVFLHQCVLIRYTCAIQTNRPAAKPDIHEAHNVPLWVTKVRKCSRLKLCHTETEHYYQDSVTV